MASEGGGHRFEGGRRHRLRWRQTADAHERASAGPTSPPQGRCHRGTGVFVAAHVPAYRPPACLHLPTCQVPLTPSRSKNTHAYTWMPIQRALTVPFHNATEQCSLRTLQQHCKGRTYVYMPCLMHSGTACPRPIRPM